MKVIKRMNEPTPDWFKRIVHIGLILGGTSAGILALPAAGVVLPATLVTIAGYMAVAGVVAAAIAKTGSTKDSLGTFKDLSQ